MCTCAYTYVHTYIGRQLLICTYVHPYSAFGVDVWMRARARVCVCVCACVHVCVCVRACVCACVCINLYVLYIEVCTCFSPQHALQCSPNTWMTTVTQFPGVLDERQYWKTRLTTLTSIREQLSSLLALTILSHLEEAHSSYSGAFGQVYKDVDKVLSSCIHTLSSSIHTV